MIVWGGSDLGGFANTGGKYNPSTNSWTSTSTVNAPTVRFGHTAVWTGNEMIVWGGVSGSDLNTGARYNPITGTWTTMTTVNAPPARDDHTAVWTGSEMIVWGGSGGGHTGAKYNPITDSWTAISTTNAPSPRIGHTAVWTGGEMIVWGGVYGDTRLNTGARYNPSTDTWAATTIINAPTGRSVHTAVWTGSEMTVWGGYDGGGSVSTGRRYNPNTDSWVATGTVNVPTARSGHTAVWRGNEMVVWGGYDGSSSLNTGGRYNPDTDTWAATSTVNAPTDRGNHTAVLTDSQMIIWGGEGDATGYVNTGGRYCAPAPTPTPTPTPTPSPVTALNISTRLRVQTGNNVLIGGFIITGSTPKQVVVRGIGPSLGAFGVPDPLTDPTLELRSSTGTLIMQNDNWQDDATQASQLTALGLAPTDTHESALVATLDPNASYTVIVAGNNGGTGVGLVEAYDTNSSADSELANISTRGFVDTGANVMIGGFILSGANSTQVALRGIGPSLSQFVSPALADPTLELHDGNGTTLMMNDNWQDDPTQAAQLIAHGLAPQNELESGIFATLSPGAYTAILAGKNGATGIALVEVYNIHWTNQRR